MANSSEARANRGAVIRPTDSTAETPERTTPTFEYAPGAPVDGNPILFDASVSTDAAVRQYEWDFGDGTTAPGEKASNVYDSGGEKPVTLTVTDEDGETTTVRETVTVYREIPTEVAETDSKDDLVPVVISGTDGFDPTEVVAIESLRFGAPMALAMGSGAAPIRSEVRDGALQVWFRADETGLDDADALARLAGRTTDDVPLAGTADVSPVSQ